MSNTGDLDRTLFISDNLPFLQSLDTESVDLIVIDPPFGKNQTFEGTLRPPLTDEELGHEYDLLSRWGIQNEDDAYDAGLEFPDQTGETATFRDIWDFRVQVTQEQWDKIGESCPAALRLIEATRYTHSDSIAAYITFMTMRMLEIRRVLKKTGSVYLHCDHEANAYLRQMMDAVFGRKNFRNEIIWYYQTSSGSPRGHFIRNTDTILFYAKSPDNIFNVPLEPWPESTLRKWQRDEKGIYRTNNGKRYYIDPNGKRTDNVWEITLSSRAAERTGYRTQKPQELARRIIKASSKQGDLVLDCFAGCAYVPVAAEQTGRRWIACDMSPRAWTVVRRQFQKQADLRIVTEFDYAPAQREEKHVPQFEESAYTQPDLGDKRIIRIRGPHQLPERSTPDEPQQLLGVHELPPPQFRQRALENNRRIWEAFVDEWGTRCWYCGTEKARDRRELELDHIEPNKRDGTNDDCWNRALACAPCNSDKDDKLTVEQTIDKALASGRIQTPALRDEQVKIFEQRHEWAKARWEGLKA